MSDSQSRLSHAVGPTQGVKRSGFSSLDGQSIAVVLRTNGKQFVFLGVALFQRDDVLGGVLIISATDSQSLDTKLIFSELEWRGRIFPDLEYGCEFCMIPELMREE